MFNRLPVGLAGVGMGESAAGGVEGHYSNVLKQKL